METFHTLLSWLRTAAGRGTAASNRRSDRIGNAGLRFGRDEHGATALEFALVAPPFFIFVLMIFQIALYHYGQQSLDYATRIASRSIMVGTVPADARTLASFRDKLVCPAFLMNFACREVVVNAYKVNVTTSNEASNSGIYEFIDPANKHLRPVPAAPTFCIGGPGDYILLDISYQFPNFLGSLIPGFGQTPFLLRSTNLFRNEPFKSAGASC